MRIISSYLSEKLLLYDTDEVVKKHIITGGVSQDSVLPMGVQIIDYAGYIAVTIVGKELHQIEANCMTTLARIKSYFDNEQEEN